MRKKVDLLLIGKLYASALFLIHPLEEKLHYHNSSNIHGKYIFIKKLGFKQFTHILMVIFLGEVHWRLSIIVYGMFVVYIFNDEFANF